MRLRAAFLVTILLFGLRAAPANERQHQAAVWPLWESYKSRFVAPEGRVIDWQSGGRTTSEGQAYALFFALVANDRESFRKILQWTETNLSRGSLRRQLPSWLWEKEGEEPGYVKDPNSASDADLWIAYVLLSAGREWGISEYQSLGHSLAQRIVREEVVLLPGEGPMLLPGRQGFRPDSRSYVLNPSYLAPQILRGLGKEEPQSPWPMIAENLLKLTAPGVGAGFAMDWATHQNGGAFRATAGPNREACGSYDAIRVYLWVGMLDPGTPEYSELLDSLAGMGRYMSTHAIPPESVSPNGSVLSDRGPIGFSAALLPFLMASGDDRQVRNQQSRMRKELSEVTGLYGKEPHYYDQNLALFGEGWLSRRFRFDASGGLRLEWRKQ